MRIYCTFAEGFEEPPTVRMARPAGFNDNRPCDWSGSMKDLYLNDESELFHRDVGNGSGGSREENAMDI